MKKKYTWAEFNSKFIAMIDDFFPGEHMAPTTPFKSIDDWNFDPKLAVSDLVSAIERTFDIDIEFPDIPRDFYKVKNAHELAILLCDKYNLADTLPIERRQKIKKIEENEM